MIERCSRYLRDYEHISIYKKWYDKICAIYNNEEESDFLMDVLHKGYQVKANFLLFQGSNASKDNIKSFEKAYFSTTPGKKIPKLWNKKYVYVPGKDKKDLTNEEIYRYFQDAMSKKIRDIKYEEIKQNDDIIITMVKKSNNKYIKIKIENIGDNKDKKIYKLLK